MVDVFVMRVNLTRMLNLRIVNHRLQQHFGAVEIDRARTDGRKSGAEMNDTLVVPHLLILVHCGFVTLKFQQDFFHSQ